MHLKRQEAQIKLPIPRKGTTFVARALSNIKNSVPVVIAIRDILLLARTTAEVKKMIHQKLLKLNGRPVKDHRESITLFNILEADKPYVLTLIETGKFALEEVKDPTMRLCKVTGKTLIKNNKIQLNLHDGSNLISEGKISIGDSVYLDMSGKIKRHILLEKGKKVLVIKGKYLGLKGVIESLERNKVTLSLPDNKLTTIDKGQVIVQ